MSPPQPHASDRGSNRGARGKRARTPGKEGTPRTARVNEALREVLADELERMADIDDRLVLLTITGVSTEPDLRHCMVMFDSLDEARQEALAEGRVRLQAAISRQLRLKRTPQLSFMEDPAVAAGRRIEDVLRGIAKEEEASPPGD